MIYNRLLSGIYYWLFSNNLLVLHFQKNYHLGYKPFKMKKVFSIALISIIAVQLFAQEKENKIKVEVHGFVLFCSIMGKHGRHGHVS